MCCANSESYITRQLLITACLNIGQILVGYGVFWTAPIIPKLQNIEETPLSYVISETESSWIASLIFIGTFTGYTASYVANSFGRRVCLILGGVITFIAYVFLTFANRIGLIYLGRFLVGSSVCFLTVGTITYLGEIASPNIRGALMTSTSVFHSFGGLLMYCIGPYVSYAEVGYVIMCLAAVYTASCFLLPESPLYYVLKGDEDSAKDSLRKLGRSKDIDTELKNMLEQALEKESNIYVWRKLFTEKVNRRALFVTMPLLLFQQSSGIIAVIFFATTIFKKAGSSVEPNIATIIVGATMFVSSIFSPMFVEKSGRRILLIISTSGCCVSMAVLGVYFYLDHIGNTVVLQLGWLPLVCFVAAIFFYAVGLSIIPNTLTGEMFAPKVRGLGSYIAFTFGWLSGLISTTIFGYIVVGIGTYATMWMFAAVNCAGLIFVTLFVPETTGKTLLEIGTMMEE